MKHEPCENTESCFAGCAHIATKRQIFLSFVVLFFTNCLTNRIKEKTSVDCIIEETQSGNHVVRKKGLFGLKGRTSVL